MEFDMLMTVELLGLGGSFRQEGEVFAEGDLAELIDAALAQYRSANSDWWRPEHGGCTMRWGAIQAGAGRPLPKPQYASEPPLPGQTGA
jgi:hypothetical protein